MTAQKLTINQIILIAILLGLGVFLFISLNSFINPALGAIIFYVIGLPFHKRLMKYKFSPTMAALTVILGLFLIFIIPISLISYALFNKLYGYLQQPEEFINQFKLLLAYIKERFDIELLNEENIEKIKEFASAFVGNIVVGLFSILADLAMMAFFLFYLLYSHKFIEEKIIQYSPLELDTLNQFKKELDGQVFSNVIGSPMLALLQSIAAIGGFYFLDVPEPLFWGFMCGIFSFIPFVGSALIWIPASFVLISQGNTGYGVGLLVYGTVVITNIDNVFRFVLQKKFADVHPVITILGVIMGVDFFGISGLIFGPLLISIFLILLKAFLKEYVVVNKS